MDQDGWRGYLAAYHDERPGITEEFLGRATLSPYAWLAEPLGGVDGLVLDLACGSAPLRPLLPRADWLGLDASPGELAAAARAGRGPLIQADAARLPLPDGSVAAVAAAMCLPVLTPLDQVLTEIRRVLRPGGVLAALVPSTRGLSLAGAARWVRIMATLRTVRQPWPNPHARDGLASLLRGAASRSSPTSRGSSPLACSQDRTRIYSSTPSICLAWTRGVPSWPSRAWCGGRCPGAGWSCRCAGWSLCGRSALGRRLGASAAPPTRWNAPAWRPGLPTGRPRPLRGGHCC
jgi:SAM-dependent methyltransferase